MYDKQQIKPYNYILAYPSFVQDGLEQDCSNSSSVSNWNFLKSPRNFPFLYNLFSAANLALAGFPLTNSLGENLPSRH